MSKCEVFELQEIYGKGWTGMNRGVKGNEIGKKSEANS